VSLEVKNIESLNYMGVKQKKIIIEFKVKLSQMAGGKTPIIPNIFYTYL
jgi:hypothetical protein